MAYGSVNVPGSPGTDISGLVPDTRKVNGKPLSDDISLTAKDVGASAENHSHAGYAAEGHKHTAADVGAAPVNHEHSDYAPTRDPSFTGVVKLFRLSVGDTAESAIYSNSITIGSNAKTKGLFSIAVGNSTEADGNGMAIGHCLIGSAGQLVIGSYNKSVPCEADADNTLMIVGNGVSYPGRSNCFRIVNSGKVYASGAYNSTGADYAELFEWADGNPDGEDRIGRFVTLDGAKIRLAGPDDDFILGIVSGNPSVVGDVYDDQWQGMYLYDIFGRPIWEDAEVPEETREEPDPENPEQTITKIIPAHTERRQKLNPDYDASQKYIPRTERPEWGCVGMLGKLVVIDDGTCQVNGWAAVGEGGGATASAERTRFRVMERLDRDGKHYIRVLSM